MQNPVDIERRFNELQRQLSHVSSLRYRWRLIADFIASLGEDLKQYDSYILQLVAFFPVLEHSLSFAGTDPQQALAIIELLDRCEQQIPELSEYSRYEKARTALRDAAALLLAFTGSWAELLHLYRYQDAAFKPTECDWWRDVPESQHGPDPQKLKNIAERAREHEWPDLAQWLVTVGSRWQQLQKPSQSHSLLVPVVESHPEESDEKLGRLRRLTARVAGEVQNQQDSFKNNFAVIGAEKATAKEAAIVEQVVRERLNKTHPNLRSRFFEVLFSYSLHKGWHSGSSSQTGAASISYCAILDYARQRETYEVDPNLVITGRLEEDGTVKPVDEAGIPAKAEAAFFSWAEMLVVPAAQQQVFERQLSRLRRTYPNRKSLKVVGIGHLRELFFDRRITRRTILSRPRFYLQKAWDRKSSVAGTVVILCLLVLVGRLWYGPIDKNPVNGVFKGENLFVENQFGQTLVRLQAGLRSDSHARTNSTGGGSPEVQFVDINSDGVNEVIWATNGKEHADVTEEIKCWSVSGDSLVWKRPMIVDLQFPRKSGMRDNNFVVQTLLEDRFPDGSSYIIGSATMRGTFPGLIFLLDPRTGKLIRKYVHTGQIGDMELIDIQGDGLDELVFSGVNNAFQKAVLGVLDLRNFSGHSPLRGDYVLEGIPRAEELDYLLIPKTIVGQYLDPVDRYNVSHEINYSRQDSMISVWVRDGRADPFEGIDRSLRILAYFDFDLHPLGFTTSDQYDIVSEQLYQAGKISSEPDYDYFKAFKDSISYWNGSFFVPWGQFTGGNE